MLRETYFAVWEKVKKDNPDAVFVSVALKRPAHTPIDFSAPALAPSAELLSDYKEGLSWEEYTKRFIAEMDCDEARWNMDYFKNMAIDKDVYLVCWERSGSNCHRYLLLDLMKE